MSETKSLALYTIGNSIVGTQLNTKRNAPQPVPLRTDYLSDLQTLITNNELYYLYKNIADRWCFCSVFEESAILLNLDSSIIPGLINSGSEPIVCQLQADSAIFIYPLTPGKILKLSTNDNQITTQKEYYENLIANLKADFNLQLKSKDEYYSAEMQKIKDTHESVLSNIQDQYNELAAMAEDLQKEGKMWREKYFKR